MYALISETKIKSVCLCVNVCVCVAGKGLGGGPGGKLCGQGGQINFEYIK